jgi:phosphotriesterase-related protein
MTGAAPAASTPRQVISVLGPVPADAVGITDAHNHVWIEPPPGAAPDSPVLTQSEGILAELVDYRQAGGSAIVDCQPGGCGRNANRLAELARASGVVILCATGFHRRRYYPAGYWLWSASPEASAASFTAELRDHVQEAAALPVRAGLIKAACEATLVDTPLNALEGAAQAAAATGAAVEIHTEKGASAEAIFAFMVRSGAAPHQVVLCHMDKRPDFGLHRELVQAGALLEYDTFYRPKYDPEHTVWPLIEQMVNAGLGRGLALATDIAEAALWARLGGGPGLVGLLRAIRPRLEAMRIPADGIAGLLGGNIIDRLAVPAC